MQLFFPHSNPPARVDTNIKPYKVFTFAKAYRGESFFWGLLPQRGDELTVTFDEPTVIDRWVSGYRQVGQRLEGGSAVIEGGSAVRGWLSGYRQVGQRL